MKQKNLQSKTMDKLLNGQVLSSAEFLARNGSPLSNIVNRLKNKGVPITKLDNDYFISAIDMFDARKTFGSVD